MRAFLRAAIVRATKGVGIAAVFGVSALGAVVHHSDMPPARRALALAGERILARLFEGSIVVQDVRRLHLGAHARVHIGRVDVLDRDGHTTITAHEVEADLALATLLRSLSTTGAPEVIIDGVHVRDAVVSLDRDAGGGVRLAHAFALRETGEPLPDEADKKPSAEPRVRIDRAAIDHAWVRGDIVPPALDGDVRAVVADVDYEGGVVHIGLDQADVTLRAPSLPLQKAPLVGRATGKLDVTAASARLVGDASFTGEVGGLPVTATATLDGDRVDAKVEVPRSSPETIAGAFGDMPFTRDVGLTATAKGAWPSLAVDARATIGDEATVTAIADVDLRGPVTFTGAVTAEKIDLRAFGGPASSLSARLTGTAALQDETSIGTFRLTSEAGTLDGQTIPPVVADGRFQGQALAVSARAQEPGVQTAFSMVLDVPTRAITFDVQARAPDLRAAPRLGRRFGGSAAARATGKIDLTRATVASVVTATGDGLTDGTTHVGSARVTAYVSGPLRAPVADAELHAKEVRFAADGKTPLLYPEVTATARLSAADMMLTRVDVRARTSEGDPDAIVHARAEAIALGGRGVVVRGGRIEGVGGPLELSASVAPGGGLRVRAHGRGLDVGRAAAATGLAFLRDLPRGSRADVDVDLDVDGGRPDGSIAIHVDDQRGFHADLRADVDRGRARGDATVALAPFGEVRARSFTVDLGGPLDDKTLTRMTGEVELEGKLDLTYATGLLEPAGIVGASGIVAFTAHGARWAPGAMPTVRATVKTSGLSLTRETAGRPETTSGIDVTAHAAWDGLTDDTEASIVLWDGRSAVFTANAKSTMPIGSWIRGEAKPTREAFAALEVALRADVPRREIRSLPAWVFPAQPEGSIAATLTSAGPLGSPHVTAFVRGDALRDRNRRRNDPVFGPIDATVDLRWDGEDVVAVVTADEQDPARSQRERGRARRPGETLPGGADKRKRGSARGLVLARASARELLVHGADPDLRVSAEVSADEIDLAPLPLPYQARGTLSGRFSVRDVNGDPTFNATARFNGLVLSNATVGSGDVVVGGRDRGLFGVARVEQAEGGEAQFQIVSQALRLQGREVAWDDAASTRIDYAVRSARLSILRPFVRRLFPEIDGRLDGRGSITVVGAEQNFEGGVAISEGRLYVNILGEEVTNVNAMVHFEPNGVFRVQEATGRIDEGDLRASVVGRMQGLRFQAANASVVIPSKRGIPLSTEGATYAEATGQITAQMQMSPDRSTLLCAVDVPTARIELPDRQTQQLQSTEDDPTIAVGRRTADGTFELARRRRAGGAATTTTAEEDRPLGLRITTSVGRDVWIEGRGMKIAATGLVLVDIDDDIGLTGRIDLSEGTVDVQGRRFTIDHGTLTFLEGEEPSNPTLLASAYWDAPDGTRVWAEFADPIDTGKLTLRSEPPYSYNEILSLILFGRPEGNVGGTHTAGSSASASGAGVAGGVVAPGLNRALEELSGGELEIKANVASTQFQQQSRPEVNIRRGRVGVTVGYVLGVQSQIQPDRMLVTFDWQFLPRWSLAATRGDASTTILDVLYRYRY